MKNKFLIYLKSIPERVSASGTGHLKNESEIRKTKLVNAIAFTTLVVFILYFIPSLFLGLKELLPLNIFGQILFLSVLSLNFYRKNFFARHFFVISVNIFFFLNCIWFSKDTGIHYTFFPISLLPLLFFEKIRSVLSYFSLSLVCFFGAHAWFLTKSPIVDFHAPTFYYANMFSIFGGLTLFVFYFRNSQRNYRLSLEKKNLELQRISYSLSHELKSPLRGISSLIHFIREDNHPNLNPESKEHLESVISRVERIDGLVDSIQQYFQTTSEYEQKNQFYPTEIINHITEKWKKDENISFIISPSSPHIHSYYKRYSVIIRQLINLLLAYNDKIQKNITIDFKTEDNYLETHIADNGPGLSQSERQKIHAFFLSSDVSEIEKIPALSLAVVKKITEENGARISVNSGENLGTTFIVFWPIK